MRIDIPQEVLLLLNKLNKHGYEAFVVGGCVRDSLLGKTPADWDICTNATPQQMQEVFADLTLIPTGLKHGTVTIHLRGRNYEITTYRSEEGYSDGRSPDKVKFINSLAEDLSRRDFTINAMAYHPALGLVDPCGGQADLAGGLVVAVGNAPARFEEDALRLLRAIRFASVLSFAIEAETARAITSHSALINKISSERVRDELSRILMSPVPSVGVLLLLEHNLLHHILPELVPMVGFEQYNPHHQQDVFKHSLSVLDASPPCLPIRLAALLHDAGKPATFTMDQEGVGHFYGHHRLSAQITHRLMRRLRYSRQQIYQVEQLVYYHMFDIEQAGDKAIKRLLGKLGSEQMERLTELMLADRRGGKTRTDTRPIEEFRQKYRVILDAKQPLSVKDLAIGGHDLIEQLGLAPGKIVGQILRYLLEKVLEKPELNNKKDLLALAAQALRDGVAGGEGKAR